VSKRREEKRRKERRGEKRREDKRRENANGDIHHGFILLPLLLLLSPLAYDPHKAPLAQSSVLCPSRPYSFSHVFPSRAQHALLKAMIVILLLSSTVSPGFVGELVGLFCPVGESIEPICSFPFQLCFV
jgi:hypothetical protein